MERHARRQTSNFNVFGLTKLRKWSLNNNDIEVEYSEKPGRNPRSQSQVLCHATLLKTHKPRVASSNES